MPTSDFVRAGDRVIRADTVEWVDFSRLDELRVVIHHGGETSLAEGIHAIEALFILKPSALEGKRLKWKRRAWMFHNLVGHPLMQLLALFKFYRLAMAVHDKTVPKPENPPA